MPAKISETGIFHFNQERVTALPQAAVSFATSDEYPDFAYTLGNNILSIQGHPEQPLSSMNNFLNAMQHELDQDTLSRARSQIDNGEPDSQLWGEWMMRFMIRQK
jgi:GMP synthase-like glutamine amidotransferase